VGNSVLSFFVFVSTAFILEASVRFPARGFAKILTDESAQERLSDYRSFLLSESNGSRFHEGYSLQFQLRHMPRRGSETVKTGILYGPFLGCGVSRLSVVRDSQKNNFSNFLLKNGEDPKFWNVTSNELQPILISSEESLAPLVQGMNQTAFDLLMPFVFWNGEYKNSGKVAGRPAHVFSFTCPPWITKVKPHWQNITLALDDAYDAPLRVEILGKSQIAERTLILRKFKKVGNRWIVKEIDCHDRKSRSVTRMTVTSAALGLDLDQTLFLPENLVQPIRIDPKLYLSTD
tara:strand:+ start:3721 stop:4590 length:870 start_codon:yes stop_codon:yes gene_type:complete